MGYTFPHPNSSMALRVSYHSHLYQALVAHRCLEPSGESAVTASGGCGKGLKIRVGLKGERRWSQAWCVGYQGAGAARRPSSESWLCVMRKGQGRWECVCLDFQGPLIRVLSAVQGAEPWGLHFPSETDSKRVPVLLMGTTVDLRRHSRVCVAQSRSSSPTLYTFGFGLSCASALYLIHSVKWAR